MSITGEMLIGRKAVRGEEQPLHAVNPATGSEIAEPVFGSGGVAQVAARVRTGAAGVRPVPGVAADGARRVSRAHRRRYHCAGRRADRARATGIRSAEGASRRRARPHDRPAQAVRAGRARRPMARRHARFAAAGAQAAAALGSAHAEDRARPGRGVRRQQLPARVFGGGRRHGCGARGGLPGRGEGAPRAPRHLGNGRPRDPARRAGNGFAGRRVLADRRRRQSGR